MRLGSQCHDTHEAVARGRPRVATAIRPEPGQKERVASIASTLVDKTLVALPPVSPEARVATGSGCNNCDGHGYVDIHCCN